MKTCSALKTTCTPWSKLTCPSNASWCHWQKRWLIFKSRGHDDKVRLLAYRQKDTLVLYRLEDHRDYHHGYMVPSTGYMRWFGLTKMGEGFVLRYPRRHSPKMLLPMPDYPKLLLAFRQYGDWLDRLGIGSVGALNDAIKAGRIREVILVSEALHEQQVANAAAQIASHRGPGARRVDRRPIFLR